MLDATGRLRIYQYLDLYYIWSIGLECTGMVYRVMSHRKQYLTIHPIALSHRSLSHQTCLSENRVEVHCRIICLCGINIPRNRVMLACSLIREWVLLFSLFSCLRSASPEELSWDTIHWAILRKRHNGDSVCLTPVLLTQDVESMLA